MAVKLPNFADTYYMDPVKNSVVSILLQYSTKFSMYCYINNRLNSLSAHKTDDVNDPTRILMIYMAYI
jgi:hypothetical protein